MENEKLFSWSVGGWGIMWKLFPEVICTDRLPEPAELVTSSVLSIFLYFFLLPTAIVHSFLFPFPCPSLIQVWVAMFPSKSFNQEVPLRGVDLFNFKRLPLTPILRHSIKKAWLSTLICSDFNNNPSVGVHIRYIYIFFGAHVRQWLCFYRKL